MTQITLAKNTVKGLKRKQKKCVPVRSTFLTEAGPAEGTIWFDTQGINRHAMIVQNIHDDVLGPYVEYATGWDDLEDFMECVAEGRYILIGATTEPRTHTQL